MRTILKKSLSLIMAATLMLGATALPVEAKGMHQRDNYMRPVMDQPVLDDYNEYDCFEEDYNFLDNDYSSEEYDYDVNAEYSDDEYEYTDNDVEYSDDEEGEDFHEEIVEPLTLQTKKLTVKSGKKAKIIITGNEDVSLRFSSRNKKVATVNQKGIVTGKKAGKTKITIRTDDGRIATVVVKVNGKTKSTNKKTPIKQTQTTKKKKKHASNSKPTITVEDKVSTDSDTAEDTTDNTETEITDTTTTETTDTETDDTTIDTVVSTESDLTE